MGKDTCRHAIGLLTGVFLALSIDKISAQPEEGRQEKTAQEAVMQDAIVRPRMEYDAEGLKDPFSDPFKGEDKPITTEKPVAPISAEPPPSFTIQGTIWEGKIPLAIVNNKVVKEGDTLEGAKIKTIEKKGITILFKGKEYNVPSTHIAASSNANPQGD